METSSSKLRFGSLDKATGKEGGILGAGAIKKMEGLQKEEIKSIYASVHKKNPGLRNEAWRSRIEAAKQKAETQQTATKPPFTGSRRNAVEAPVARKFWGQEANSNPIIKKRLGINSPQKLKDFAVNMAGKGPYLHAADAKKNEKALADGHPEKTSIYPEMLPGQQHAMEWGRPLQKEIAKSYRKMRGE